MNVKGSINHMLTGNHPHPDTQNDPHFRFKCMESEWDQDYI